MERKEKSKEESIEDEEVLPEVEGVQGVGVEGALREEEEMLSDCFHRDRSSEPI